jgi:CDP-diglyceride synthetase
VDLRRVETWLGFVGAAVGFLVLAWLTWFAVRLLLDIHALRHGIYQGD